MNRIVRVLFSTDAVRKLTTSYNNILTAFLFVKERYKRQQARKIPYGWHDNAVNTN
ncbi:MAG: hypothetical protein OEY06_00095 [Gammaproteobacteria bacterium]|nr:hypothetical protein [Gammaproteobacteria bacterium]